MLMGSSRENEIRGEIERFQRRVRHIRRIMADDTVTTFSLVTIPERMADLNPFVLLMLFLNFRFLLIESL